jgi:hypothetical protein
MIGESLCIEAMQRGLRIEVRGGKLLLTPASKVTPGLAARMREHKSAVLAWLANPPPPRCGAVPPLTLPLVLAKPLPSVEDRERVINFVFRQGHRASPLCAWVIMRENEYYVGPGRHWDCSLHCYAACRDAACWQLHRSESGVWLALQKEERNQE